MRVLISGSSGFIGSALVSHLRSSGYSVVRLVRSTTPAEDGALGWDPANGTIDSSRLDGFDAAIHLGGENMTSRRWSPTQKELIHNSRINSTRLLADALKSVPNPPSVFLCASASGFYGDRGDRLLTESDGPGTDFLSNSTLAWERATDGIANAGIRVCNFRFGLALSASGGLLDRLVPIFRFGLGGRLASGRQYMSWISKQDGVRAIEHVLSDNSISGPVNMSSPNPVSNIDFTAALGKALRRPAFFFVPEIALRITQGEVTDAVLASVRMQPDVLINSGFEFDHPDLKSALDWALKDR
jgi:uncharacterized protein (TIGR01777 family)